MRDAHRMKEKFDLSLDNRQIVSLLIAGIVVLGAVFVLGVVVGKKLAESDRAAGAPDLLSALDEKAAAMEKVHAEPATTFQDELTKKAGPLPRDPSAKPAKPEAVAQAKPEPKPEVAKPEPKPADEPKPEVAQAAAEERDEADPLPAPKPDAKPAAESKPAVEPKPSSESKKEALAEKKAASESKKDALAEKKAASESKKDALAEKKPDAKPEPAKKESLAERINATASAPVDGKVADTAVMPTRTTEKGTTVTASAEKGKVQATPAGKGAFTLQLSATQTREEADRFASGLKAKGYAPYIVSAQVPGKGTWYRVRLGSFPNRDAASRYLQDFRRETQMEAFVASKDQ